MRRGSGAYGADDVIQCDLGSDMSDILAHRVPGMWLYDTCHCYRVKICTLASLPWNPFGQPGLVDPGHLRTIPVHVVCACCIIAYRSDHHCQGRLRNSCELRRGSGGIFCVPCHHALDGRMGSCFPGVRWGISTSFAGVASSAVATRERRAKNAMRT